MIIMGGTVSYTDENQEVSFGTDVNSVSDHIRRRLEIEHDDLSGDALLPREGSVHCTGHRFSDDSHTT